MVAMPAAPEGRHVPRPGIPIGLVTRRVSGGYQADRFDHGSFEKIGSRERYMRVNS